MTADNPHAFPLIDPFGTADRLCARLGDGPLRLSLRLLHVRGHEFPAQARRAVARGAGPAVLGVRRPRRAEDPHHRRRAAGPAQRDVAVPRAPAPPRQRRARGAHGDDQRIAARAFRPRTGRLRRPAHQRLARHARPRQVPRRHPLGRSRRGARRSRRGGRRGPQGQDQRRGAQGLQRRRGALAASIGRMAAAST